MAVYVIAVAVVLLLLIGSYRAFGGASSRSMDPAVLLQALHAELGALLPPLSAAISAAARGETHDEDTIRAGRRRAAALQQTLDSLPTATELASADAGTARALVATALEDAGWAWRVLQAGPPGTGLAAALSVLFDDAARCHARAGPLVGSLGSGEPPDRTGNAILERDLWAPAEQPGGPSDVQT